MLQLKCAHLVLHDGICALCTDSSVLPFTVNYLVATSNQNLC